MLWALLFLSGTRSSAQPRAVSGERARAQAGKLAAAGLYEEAADAFHQAFVASGRASDLVHAGDLQVKLGRADLAAGTYEQSLAVPDAHFHDAASVALRLKKIDRSVGKIDVHASEPGAELRQRDQAGQGLPLARPVRLLPGRRRILVAKEGFETLGIDVEIQAGETRVIEAKLVPLATVGHVLVSEKNQAAVRVFVDEVDHGAAPQDLELSLGDHTINVRGADLRSPAMVVHVDPHKREKVEVEARSTLGAVTVHVSPVEAVLVIDGSAHPGRAKALSLEEGEHSVDVSAVGYFAKQAVVKVVAGGTSELSVSLERSGPSPERVETERRRQEESETDSFRGGYGSFVLFQSNALTETSIACDTATCDESADLGGGLRFAGGYSFGAMGIEASLLAAASHRGHDVHHDASAPLRAYDESISMIVGHAIVAVGPRLRTTTHGVQFTAGVEAGAAFADFGTSRGASNGYSDSTSDNEHIIAPGGEADLAISFGSRPGASFTLGVLAFGDLPGHLYTGALNRSVTPDGGGAAVNIKVPPYRLTSGPEVFVGPMLGVSFGH